jgi:hypothetical protein
MLFSYKRDLFISSNLCCTLYQLLWQQNSGIYGSQHIKNHCKIVKKATIKEVLIALDPKVFSSHCKGYLILS